MGMNIDWGCQGEHLDCRTVGLSTAKGRPLIVLHILDSNFFGDVLNRIMIYMLFCMHYGMMINSIQEIQEHTSEKSFFIIHRMMIEFIVWADINRCVWIFLIVIVVISLVWIISKIVWVQQRVYVTNYSLVVWDKTWLSSMDFCGW
jgi:hypothetical protein